jgi:hypothetical protein
MRVRWLICVAGILLCGAACCSGQDATPTRKPTGYLVLPNPDPIVRVSNPPVAPYWPQAGDIVVYDNHNKFFHLMFKIADTKPPTHTAMVIARPDGSPALLELAGPHTMTANVCIMEVEERFKAYPGEVAVRRIRQPLTPEQSRDLTQFATAEEGKRFALWRCILMGTPLCPRTGMRREYFGHTYATRNRWFCSELVVAAGTKAGLFDGRFPANATVPRDLAVDEKMDISDLFHPPAPWTLTPPAQPSEVQPTAGNR